jgi:hypothetical protein
MIYGTIETRHMDSFLPCRHDVLAGVDRLGRDLAHFDRGHMAEDIEGTWLKMLWYQCTMQRKCLASSCSFFRP